MARRWVVLAVIFAVLFCGFSSVSAVPTKIVAGALSKAVSALVNWIWTITSASNTVVSTRSMIKFERGYVVETLLDGSKMGIEPYSVGVSPSGELLILDAENSNVHKISMPVSQFCRPKLFAGSSEGYSGHVDGKLRDARMSHPRGLTVDQRGNIYIADTKNKAIRKISDAGVTTIAGGKWRKSGHLDGPSEDSKFSNDFDVVYVGSSCSLLVVDRGNQAIREIQLRAEDCTEYDGSFLLGMALLTAAMLLGYMLARFQFRVLATFSSKNDSRVGSRNIPSIPPYGRVEKSVRRPLIPSEEEEDNQPEENIICSLGKLFLNTGSSAAEIFVALLLGARRKASDSHSREHYQVNKHAPSRFGVQENFAASYGRETLETMTRKPYSCSTTRLESVQRYKRIWGDNGGREEQPYPSSPKMFYNRSSERNEVVFGEVQEEEQLCEQNKEKCCVGGGGCVEGRSFSNNKHENAFVTEKRRIRG
ncbi:NHL domain-containing protein [Cucumis melo var. makuwa]|uniref:NHL domain-containing protein n=2 Tax=Cucumis melo TaxID=3656 RepID=A0A5A7UER2_CUCMM|nr:uncharacterized protein LOC103487068 [Cucumis melo]KAA0053690.1 NHL domain-containing protein [Cucumis melo var. makuwa]